MIKLNPHSPPRTSHLTLEVFGGQNTKEAKEEVFKYNATAISNCRIDGEKLYKRLGHTIKGASSGGTTGVLGLGKFYGATPRLVKGYDTKVRYWNGSAWADAITGLTTNKEQSYATFAFQGSSTTETGTATSATEYSLVDTGQGWTVNAYRNKFITTTGGTGTGQTKLIVSNDTDTIKIQSPWDVTPSTDTTFTIYNTAQKIIVQNGTDTAKTWDGTTQAANSNVPKGSFTVVHNDRLWVFNIADHMLYYSDLFNGEEFPDLNTYPVEPQSDAGEPTGIISLGEQLVISKQYRTYILTGYYPEQFELIPRSNSVGCIAPKSLQLGNNVVYFRSTRGFEAFNPLETDFLDDYLTLSDSVTPTLDAQTTNTTASGGFYKDLFFSAQGTNYANIDIYDSLTSKRRFSQNKQTVPQFLADTGYNPKCFFTAYESGLPVFYHGDATTGSVYQMETGNVDVATHIDSSWESKNFDIGTNASLSKMWIIADTATDNELGGSTTQFDITNTSGTTFRYTWDDTGTDPEIGTYVEVGNQVRFAAQNFDDDNNGTFTVTGVGAKYIEVTNADGVAETNKTIGTGSIIVLTDFVFSVSPDGGAYQTIDTVIMNDITTGENETKLSSKIRGRYFRFKITNNDANATVALKKLEFEFIKDIKR